MSIHTYSDALRYIYSYITYDPTNTSRWSLERLKDLLAEMGQPHQQFPSILIAGTKGKGSTSAMCESMLRVAGHKTGLYTSPHLHSFRERIKLNGELITEAQLIHLVNQYRPYFEARPNLTIFELITALAFVAFAEAEVQVAVLEVGLGGRLDATNAVDPTVAVITPISYDHMQILGDTLTLIASEKAGIIRPKALVISAPQVDEAMQVIQAVCQENEARLVVIDKTWQWTLQPPSLEGQKFALMAQTTPMLQNPIEGEYTLPLLGAHQAANAVTALAAVSGFAEQTGLAVSAEARHAGLAQVVWQGRLEILHREPYLVVDSAMNGDSAEKLAQALRTYFPDKAITFILGVSADHPMQDILAALLPITKAMFVVASSHPRAEKAVRLAHIVSDLGYQATVMPDVAEAMRQAITQAQPDNVVCVTGSLFLVADAREIWLRQSYQPLPPFDPIISS